MEPMKTEWRKAQRSTDNGGNCVEIAIWRKSRRSTDNGGDCVEVAVVVSGVAR